MNFVYDYDIWYKLAGYGMILFFGVMVLSVSYMLIPLRGEAERMMLFDAGGSKDQRAALKRKNIAAVLITAVAFAGFIPSVLYLDHINTDRDEKLITTAEEHYGFKSLNKDSFRNGDEVKFLVDDAEYSGWIINKGGDTYELNVSTDDGRKPYDEVFGS